MCLRSIAATHLSIWSEQFLSLFVLFWTIILGQNQLKIFIDISTPPDFVSESFYTFIVSALIVLRFIYYSVLLCCFAKLFQAEIKLQFSQVSTNNHGRQRFADLVPMHFKLMESPTSVKFRLSPYKLSSPCLTRTTQVVKLTMRYSFWVIVNYLQNLTIS